MTTEIKVNELDKVTGGNFLPNDYTEEEYRSYGIMVFKNMITPDIFIWKGQQISLFTANFIVFFVKRKGRQPDSLNELEDFLDPKNNEVHYVDGI